MRRRQLAQFTRHGAGAATAGGSWSVFATDVERGEDIDVLSALRVDDKIAWYENREDDCPNDPNRIDADSADVAIPTRTVTARAHRMETTDVLPIRRKPVGEAGRLRQAP